MNFQISTELNSKLSYTPCYMQCGNIVLNYLRRTKPFCFIFWEGKLKFKYLYIKEKMNNLKQFIKTTIKKYLNEQKQILLAPNGKPSNLPKNLYAYVRTDEFKNWFGDWENTNNSSKIVDGNGEPMLVFHGTKVKFNDFDEDKQKIGWLGRGFYFTNDKNATKEYGKSVMKIFLNIRKPFIVKGESPNDVNYEIREKYGNIDETDVSIILIQKGYDGVVFNHWDKGNMISCFSSNQIKIIS